MSTQHPNSSSRFEPKPLGKSYLRLRLSYLLNTFKTRPVTAIATGLVVYLTAFNVGMRWWKGPDHPITRLQWQIMKANGTLPKEFLEKESVIAEYYKSRWYNTPDSFPQVTSIQDPTLLTLKSQ